MASPPGDPTSSEPTSRILERQFEDLGWCPHQYRRLQQERSNATFRYLSTLDRRNFRPTNHRACHLQPTCVANNVDMKKYVTKHTETCSGACTFIGVDYDQIVDIIRNGGVPIVGINLEPTSTSHEPVLRLTVTPRRVSIRYTVISHVWSDGLGNPSANALPACQIRRLYAQLTSLPLEHESSCFTVGSLQIDWWRRSFILNADSQPPLFWMDTLCIPVKSEHSHLRTKAIDQMASIYAAANQELVLDAELMQCEAHSAPALELLARMTCSAWMTRSWTLQEGVLARECVFQFKDCALDPTHEWCLYGARPGATTRNVALTFPAPIYDEHWAVYRELYNVLWDTLHQDWKTAYLRNPPKPVVDHVKRGGLLHTEKIYQLPAVRGLSEQDQDGLDTINYFAIQLGEDHRLKQLVDTWNELANRSTTMPEDLHVIIANLLDFNADSIMRLPSREERMRAMVLSFDLLPVSLLWNTGPRWRECASTTAASNNRWIPVEPSKFQLSATPVMRVTAEWLELDLQRGTSGAQILRLREHGGKIARYSHFTCSISPESTYQVTLVDRESGMDFANTSSVTDDIPHYLIIEGFTLPSNLIKGALLRSFSSSGPGGDGVVRLSFVCPVTLRMIPHQLDCDEVHAEAEVLPLNTKVVVKYGQSIPQCVRLVISNMTCNLPSAFHLPYRQTQSATQATIDGADNTDRIPGFTPYARRLTRGPCLQGTVAVIALLPIPAIISFVCLLGFIVIMARPPHTFTPAAKGLLAVFVILYIGSFIVGIAAMIYIEMFKYRMWLSSFENGWKYEDQPGWWIQYMRLESWLGGKVHAVVAHVRRTVRTAHKRFLLMSTFKGKTPED